MSGALAFRRRLWGEPGLHVDAEHEAGERVAAVGRRSVGALEEEAAARQGVHGGGELPTVSVGAEVVGAERVDRHEHEVGAGQGGAFGPAGARGAGVDGRGAWGRRAHERRQGVHERAGGGGVGVLQGDADVVRAGERGEVEGEEEREDGARGGGAAGGGRPGEARPLAGGEDEGAGGGEEGGGGEGRVEGRVEAWEEALVELREQDEGDQQRGEGQAAGEGAARSAGVREEREGADEAELSAGVERVRSG